MSVMANRNEKTCHGKYHHLPGFLHFLEKARDQYHLGFHLHAARKRKCAVLLYFSIHRRPIEKMKSMYCNIVHPQQCKFSPANVNTSALVG